MRVSILGVPYDVEVVPLPDGTEGEHRPNEAKLVVSDAIASIRRWVVLRHEIGHAAFWESGVRANVKAVLRAHLPSIPEEQLDQAAGDLEEIVTETYSAVLCHTLETMGWLMPPGDVR